MRGYCGIGILNAKTPSNLGTLWRSAYNLGANFIFTIGDRYHHQNSDTVKAWKHIPYFRFEDIEDFKKHIPYNCLVIGVEILEDAEPLERFVHPDAAVYLLGAEDHGLTPEALGVCQHTIKISSNQCLNVSCAGAIILYDRRLKMSDKVDV